MRRFLAAGLMVLLAVMVAAKRPTRRHRTAPFGALPTLLT